MQTWKVLNEDGTAYHGGTATWPLPNGKPGKWMPKLKGEIIPCKHGYHLCREQNLVQWLGPAIFVAEYSGECIEHGDKVVVSRARLVSKANWNETITRMFCADVAERVLPIFEKQYPNDDRPRKAIEAARAFARGEIDAAAWAAASAAARAAAWAAASDAASDAARDAAKDAARAAAWDAECQWQIEHLHKILRGELYMELFR